MSNSDAFRFAETITEQVRLLRFLANELEAGRAKVDLEINAEREVYEEPRSWNAPHLELVHRVRDLGSKWKISAATLKSPEHGP